MTGAASTPDAARLAHDLRSPQAVKQIAAFHQDYLDEVKRLVATHDIVVVGMGMNPVVKTAKSCSLRQTSRTNTLGTAATCRARYSKAGMRKTCATKAPVWRAGPRTM